jgi:glycosyltransferase involved in cell wall biosynthesis
MEKASVYVSTAIADGTSPALLEAIAAGLAPVVTDIEANRSLVSNEKDGFLFTPKDPKDLAEKIIRALSGSIPKGSLDLKSRKMKDSISWGSIGRKFITSYNQLVMENNT